ncbi:protoheme IX farnesyltransferase [Virgibacillus natechei]|uniref:Protoheme IX farnesyltransferase n=1 Tax=Virgibacillus natechei TaxID=1216297 RepID=A0ABS4IJP6_9BACI|nr:heme o synthase [Virgibacillus natechei]MBP1970661.1 protoheme IX farnesyltransferase [Virgibacillus natechei]UZD13953.1 heme o synthase [Virgibacillus natechei]
MNNEMTSSEKMVTTNNIISDLKSILKLKVLIANILPVFTAFWLAIYITGSSFTEHLGLFLLTMIGSTLIVAGALLFNNWYEVDLDKEMLRTKSRPTVTGNFSLQAVFRTAVALTVLGLILMLFTTIEAAVYAFLGWFVYVVLYTVWSKRRYTLNTVIGSLSGAFTPLIGWAAIEPAFHIVPIVLFMMLFIWQIPHTFAIAIKRHDEYKAAGVPMLPVVHGIAFTKRQILVYIACLFPLPFFLSMFGSIFIVIATLLNVGFLYLAIRGFYTNNELKWAQQIFIYSLVYLIAFFLVMIIASLLV